MNLHPPSPPFPRPRNLPNHVSGSHASKWTADVAVVLTTACTRHTAAVETADDWHDPGVVTLEPAAICVASRIVVFSSLRVPFKAAHLSEGEAANATITKRRYNTRAALRKRRMVVKMKLRRQEEIVPSFNTTSIRKDSLVSARGFQVLAPLKSYHSITLTVIH